MVLWNLTLFSLLVAHAVPGDLALWGAAVMDSVISVLCGDCRKKQVGLCGMELSKETYLLPVCVLCPHFIFSAGLLSVRLHPPGPSLLDTHLAALPWNKLECLEFSCVSDCALIRSQKASGTLLLGALKPCLLFS